MRNIHQYFDIIHSTIIHSMAMDYEVEYLPISQTEGYVEGVLYFADKSRLEFTERVEIRSRRPQKQIYRYQYIKSGERVFGYDNAPHHPHLLNFPHHKHEGDTVITATEPSLQKVLLEIATLMEAVHEAEGCEPYEAISAERSEQT
ncbi:MAG: hypothetical protein H8D67_04300 [Deltaproteobacteria bacterium]|nr:hypothetical protein [Deltaproteobacteria bacterium]